MATDESTRVTRAERALLLRGIYVIVNEGAHDPLAIARAALDAGVRVVQYRAKAGIVQHNVQHLREMTRAVGALLIMNDDWRAALAYDCDGVHLGPDDNGFAHVAPVRDALENRVIGLSCGTVEEARAAEAGGADYIGVGAVYATTSKADAGAPIGIDGLMRVAGACRLPVAAIGGIGTENLRDVRRSGVAMAAVISALTGHDPRLAAESLAKIWRDEEPA
jgi:thiamine-phosphate pyrophosphorylase